MNRKFSTAILVAASILLAVSASFAIDYTPLDTAQPWNHHSVDYDNFLSTLGDSDVAGDTDSNLTEHRTVRTANYNEKLLIAIELDTDSETDTQKLVDRMKRNMPVNWVFPTVNGIVETAHFFRDIYPDLVDVIEIGRSSKGRPIIAIRIGTEDEFQSGDRAGKPKPVVLFDSALHGNEREGTRILFDWMDYILNPANEYDGVVERLGYPGAPPDHTFTTMLEERIIWIVPSCSPDTLSLSRFKDDVNPARNFHFGWQWDTDIRIDSDTFYDTNSDTYTDTYTDTFATNEFGPYPYSEPENIAASRFAEMIAPSVYLHIHGYPRTLAGENDSKRYNDNIPDGYEVANGSGTMLSTQMQRYSLIDPSIDTDTTDTDPEEYIFFDSASASFIPYASGADNWVVTRNNGFPGEAALRYVCRNVSGECEYDESLPWLAEIDQEHSAVPATDYEKVTNYVGPRKYAPFSGDNEYAYYDPSNPNMSWDQRGVGGLKWGQAPSQMNANVGTFSILYELPYHDNDSTVWGSGIATVPLPSYFPRDIDKYYGAYLWGFHREEEVIQMLLRDSFYPLNKLVLAAKNPFPQALNAASGDYSDVAISALRMPKSGCSMDFTATYEDIPSNILTPRHGYYGQRDVECTSTNYGYTNSGSFEIDINILKDGVALPQHTCPSTGLAPSDLHVCTYPNVDFDKDAEYQVSCALRDTGGMETVPASVNDWRYGCEYLYKEALSSVDTSMSEAELEHYVPSCKWDSSGGGSWDTTFYTNNKRWIRFVADRSQYAVCHFDPWDERIDIEGNVDSADAGFPLDFSVPGNWSSETANLTPLVDGSTHAVKVEANGFTYVDSRTFDTSELGAITNTIGIDVKLPNPLPDPWWKGDMQMLATCEDANLHNVWIGQALFESLTPGEYGSVQFQFTGDDMHQQVLNAFQSGGHECKLTLSLTVPNEYADYYLGDIRFE